MRPPPRHEDEIMLIDERTAREPSVNDDSRPPAHAGPDAPGDEAPPRSPSRIERIERLLTDVRALLEKLAREEEYREFSVARLIGSIIQALVVGLVAWAFSDWLFQAPVTDLFIKLAFAMTLQMGAICAFLVARDAR